jgi:class 3 adenylate cyclase
MSGVRTQYARAGDVSVAYQVVGDGPSDLIVLPGFISHLECAWEEPTFARFLRRLSSFSRLILFDKRGSGLSDPVVGAPLLEERLDDMNAVLDAVGSSHASLLGMNEGGAMGVLYAATYPQRTTSLITANGYAAMLESDERPWGYDERGLAVLLEATVEHWGTGIGFDQFLASAGNDDGLKKWWARFQRMGASPSMARALVMMMAKVNVVDVLPAVHVPTLVAHTRRDSVTPVAESHFMAERIPGARLVELPGEDHLPWYGDGGVALADEVEEFLTGVRRERESERVLATVLFTDIVDSTRHAADLGDRRWQDLLGAFGDTGNREVERHRGRVVDTAGDGMLVTFDGPARGIRCARALQAAARTYGLDVRAGLHTGECEMRDGEIGGLAVHIGARVAAKAGGGEVLVSSTVTDLVVGSGIRFEDRGLHQLKGVPGEWRLFAVAS